VPPRPSFLPPLWAWPDHPCTSTTQDSPSTKHAPGQWQLAKYPHVYFRHWSSLYIIVTWATTRAVYGCIFAKRTESHHDTTE
jgi:hypothetical protein